MIAQLQDQSLDVLEPALRCHERCGFAPPIGMPERMAVNDQLTRLDSVNVKPVGARGTVPHDLGVPRRPVQVATVGLETEAVWIRAGQPQLMNFDLRWRPAIGRRAARSECDLGERDRDASRRFEHVAIPVELVGPARDALAQHAGDGHRLLPLTANAADTIAASRSRGMCEA